MVPIYTFKIEPEYAVGLQNFDKRNRNNCLLARAVDQTRALFLTLRVLIFYIIMDRDYIILFGDSQTSHGIRQQGWINLLHSILYSLDILPRGFSGI